jgi:hypothetical protein
VAKKETPKATAGLLSRLGAKRVLDQDEEGTSIDDVNQAALASRRQRFNVSPTPQPPAAAAVEARDSQLKIERDINVPRLSESKPPVVASASPEPDDGVVTIKGECTYMSNDQDFLERTRSKKTGFEANGAGKRECVLLDEKKY